MSFGAIDWIEQDLTSHQAITAQCNSCQATCLHHQTPWYSTNATFINTLKHGTTTTGETCTSYRGTTRKGTPNIMQCHTFITLHGQKNKCNIHTSSSQLRYTETNMKHPQTINSSKRKTENKYTQNNDKTTVTNFTSRYMMDEVCDDRTVIATM